MQKIFAVDSGVFSIFYLPVIEFKFKLSKSFPRFSKVCLWDTVLHVTAPLIVLEFACCLIPTELAIVHLPTFLVDQNLQCPSNQKYLL